MEDSISTFCGALTSICTNIQTNCDALTTSIQRRPIPLDSASSTFIQGLNRRVSAANEDLNLVESMTFDTVSFEELLGHCYEVFKSNRDEMEAIEERLRDYGYNCSPEPDSDEVTSFSTPVSLNSKLSRLDEGLYSVSGICEPTFAIGSTLKMLEEDPIESLSLKNLGLSELSLAALASEANSGVTDLQQPMQQCTSISTEVGSDNDTPLHLEQYLDSAASPKAMINVSREDYDNLASYIRSLAPWEELVIAVEKMNKSINAKMDMRGTTFFRLDEIEALGLGPKCRSYLLLLVKMNLLVVETIDGLISYRVV